MIYDFNKNHFYINIVFYKVIFYNFQNPSVQIRIGNLSIYMLVLRYYNLK